MVSEQEKTYKDYLELSKYSHTTQKNYMYYFRELIYNGGVNGSCIIAMVFRHNHRQYRAFIKTVCACFNIKYTDLDIPKLRGREKKTKVVYYSPLEVDRILTAANQKLKLIILLMYESGLRVSEVLNIKKKDIDLIQNLVRGIGKGRKEFKQPFSDRTAELLKQYIENKESEELIFYWAGVKNQRQKVYYKLKKLQNQIPYKPIFPHAFRHSTASNLRIQGVDLREIQEYMRHSSLITIQRYTAVDNEKVKEKAINILGGK